MTAVLSMLRYVDRGWNHFRRVRSKQLPKRDNATDKIITTSDNMALQSFFLDPRI